MANVTIERGNVVLTVDESDIDFYINKGYNLVQDGRVIRSAVPNDLGELRQYYVVTQEKIKSLEATIAELTTENRRLVKRLQKQAKQTD